MRIPVRLAAASLVVCLAGCSSGKTGVRGFSSAATVAPASPQQLSDLVSAARLTLATTSAVSLRLDASAAFGGTPKAVGGTGAFDFVSSQGQAELNRPTGAERVIFLAASVFVSQPQPGAVLPVGKVWISAGLTEQSLATNFPQFVTQVESLNPGLILSELEWGAVSAAPTGIEGGSQIHRYAVRVDLAEAQTKATGPSADAFRRAIGYQLAEMSGATVPTQITVEVGIDSRGRVVLLRSSPPGAGIGTVTLSLSRFGLPVSVGQPARAQVVDISSLAPGGERENAGGGDSDGA